MFNSSDFNYRLGELLFPTDKMKKESFRKLYGNRKLDTDAKVTRFAPSPTGYMHIGGLYVALISKNIAKHSNGVFYLRIEDTDAKREVENGVSEIIRTLKNFEVDFDEGPIGDSNEVGAYGPYKQSLRKEIYWEFAKDLVVKGLAYPCFCNADELEKIRNEQNQANVTQGYYGKWSNCLNLKYEDIESKLKSNQTFVIRVKSNYQDSQTVTIDDLIRGKIILPANELDTVILKSDGTPTYHFAHVVDDYLMRTTHVIRGDEWIASLPVHIQLFNYLDLDIPRYAHISPIMKLEDGSKRKLSKRKDPEARVQFYYEQGYPISAIKEYLFNLANSNFEEWRSNNSSEPTDNFNIKFDNMNVAGSLFDLAKLENISKNIIFATDYNELAENISVWAEKYNKEFFKIIKSDFDGFINTMHIWKENRKDIAKWSDIPEMFSYLYIDSFEYSVESLLETKNLDLENIVKMLDKYISIYDRNDSNSVWFEKIKDLATEFNYCVKIKDYKKNPENYKGSIADVCTYIRFSVTGRIESPDLYSILQYFGNHRIKDRIKNTINLLKKKQLLT